MATNNQSSAFGGRAKLPGILSFFFPAKPVNTSRASPLEGAGCIGGVWGGHIPQHFPHHIPPNINDLRVDFPHFPQTARHNDSKHLRGDFPHFPQLISSPLGRF